MVKGARGTKVKIIFQALHMTCVIVVLVIYTLNFYIVDTQFNITC